MADPEPTTRSPMQFAQLRGKVAQILSARDLALNIGYEHGVSSGMVFAILNQKGASIKDPDTGNELGSVSLPKVYVRAYMVDRKLTLARTYRTVRRGGGLGLPNIFTTPELATETLRVAEHSEAEELDEKDSIVKIGDPAVQVINPPEK